MALLIPATTTDPRSIKISKPLNAHGHPRISELMKMIVPLIQERFHACVVMPNPKNFHIVNVEHLLEYHRQLNELSQGQVRWLMKLYFTEKLTPDEIEKVAEHPDFAGLKYYPKGLTTNSEDGISDPRHLWTPGSNPYECLRFMASLKKPVSWHGADGFDARGVELDPYDQEKHFYSETFPRILEEHYDVVHIGEHLSTTWGAEYFRENGCEDTLGCTITSHHPHLDRRDVYRGGFRPKFFCYPVVNTTEHMIEIRKFTTEGYRFVGLGDDGAGHPREAKECGCCAGGVFTVGTSVELAAQLFDEMNALEHFENFASLNMARFYGIESSKETLTLIREDWHPASSFFCDDGTEVIGYNHPIRPGKTKEPPITWKLKI